MLCWVFESEFMQLPKAEGQTDRHRERAGKKQRDRTDFVFWLVGHHPVFILRLTVQAGNWQVQEGKEGWSIIIESDQE